MARWYSHTICGPTVRWHRSTRKSAPPGSELIKQPAVACDWTHLRAFIFCQLRLSSPGMHLRMTKCGGMSLF